MRGVYFLKKDSAMLMKTASDKSPQSWSFEAAGKELVAGRMDLKQIETEN